MRHNIAASANLPENGLQASFARLYPNDNGPVTERQSTRVLVIAPGARRLAVRDAMLALSAVEESSVDELHIFLSAALPEDARSALLQPEWLAAVDEAKRRPGSNAAFARRTIHTLGATEPSSSPWGLPNDVFETLRALCANDSTEVTVIASSDAGAVSVLAHSALQIVGRPRDRFFVLEYDTKNREKTPLMVEVPLVLSESCAPTGQRYYDLALLRRRGRKHLAEPGTMTLDPVKRLLRIDDVEIALPRLQFFWLYCLASIAPQAVCLRTLTGHFSIGPNQTIVVDPSHPERAEIEQLVAKLQAIHAALFPKADDFAEMFKRACGPAPGLPSVVAKLNASLKRSLGIGARPYLIAGGRLTAGYRLTLPASRIALGPAPQAEPVRV